MVSCKLQVSLEHMPFVAELSIKQFLVRTTFHKPQKGWKWRYYNSPWNHLDRDLRSITILSSSKNV